MRIVFEISDFRSSFAHRLFSVAKYLFSPDHLIRPLEDADRNRQTDLFCRFEIDNEFKLRCLLHRQIGRFGAFQDLVHVHSRAPIEVLGVPSVGHEAARIDKLLLEVDSGQPVFGGKLDENPKLFDHPIGSRQNIRRDG